MGGLRRADIIEKMLLNRIYDDFVGLVRVLADGRVEAGEYCSVWDGRSENWRLVASGMHFNRIKAGDFMQTRKMEMLN